MDDWATKHNKEIDSDDIRADDAKMKDITSLNPNPVGRRPEFKDFARGINLLGSRPRTPGAIALEIRRERAKDETGTNMSFGENFSWKAGDPPTPPVDYAELLLMLNTHSAELATLFSEACPVYMGLQQCATIMVSVKADRRKFTARFCGQFTFALMLMEWDFFHTKVSPTEWGMGKPILPQSLIPGLYEKILTREYVWREGFPPQWRSSAEFDQTGARASPGGGYVAPQTHSGGFPSGGGGYGRGGGGGGQSAAPFAPLPPTSTSLAGAGTVRGPEASPYFNYGQKMGHVHGHIRNFMRSYHEKFQGRLALGLVFREAGVTLKPHLPNSLPFLTECVNAKGENRLCYSWVLGICPMGEKCGMKESHRVKIPDAFAKSLCASIDKGLRKVYDEGQSASRTRNPKRKTQ
jgi:hypothetical protein